jgi:3-oxoacyl-[acyl-carrier protein] reductase
MEKTVVITGASRGIGAATARAFAQTGARVAVCYRYQCAQATALCEVITQQGGTAAPFEVDVASELSVGRMYQSVCDTLGEPNILVNNAGIAQQKLFTQLTEGDWDEMMDITAKGAFLCSRAVLPAMIRKKWGRIVNVSSMWGQVGASCEVHYSAAKAAVIGLTKALAQEEGLSGITVNCVAPGAIETDMLASFSSQDKATLAQNTPLGRLGTPEDVAQAIVFLASEEAAFITGQVLGVNGGFVV